MAITKYDLDINKQAIIKPVVILRQGDHDIDTMQVSLSVANEPMDLTGATVTFMGNTANGRQVIDDAHVKIIDAKGGVFEYVFPSQASSDIGEYKVAYFSIILGNGQSSTMDFRVQVLSGVDISAPVASEYITHYDTMVTELNSAYDSATRETNKKMTSTVSSLATSAATVLDSALARVNNVNSTANSASSAASKAVSMASSVASTVTSQASYINSVASSAVANVSSTASNVVNKLNNLSIGGRNYLLNSSGDTLSGWGNTASTWSITTDTARGSVFTATPTTAWTGGGTNSLYQVVNKKAVGQQVTVSFLAKSSVAGAKFHSEPQGGANAFNTNLTTDWARYSYTISNFTGTIYLMAVDAGTTYYIDDIKLEVGNIATDWTPAPEDIDNKIDNIKVGGRNYILNSSGMNASDTMRPNLIGSTSDNRSSIQYLSTGLQITNNQGNAEFYYGLVRAWTDISQTPLVAGNTYTFSFEIKGSTPQVAIRVGVRASQVNELTKITTINNAGWSNVSYTFTIPQGTTQIYIRINGANNNQYSTGFVGGETLIMKEFKLELGNMATDWTPAPEDAPSNDSQLVHKTGNEVLAGDKTLTGTTSMNTLNVSGATTFYTKSINWSTGIMQGNWTLQRMGNWVMAKFDMSADTGTGNTTLALPIGFRPVSAFTRELEEGNAGVSRNGTIYLAKSYTGSNAMTFIFPTNDTWSV